jgi:hypothetical protein
MKPPKINDLVPGEEYAVGTLFNARRACIVRVEDTPNNTIKSLLARVTKVTTCPIIVGFYDEETNSWTPAIIRQSQILGKWDEYVTVKNEVQGVTSLKNNFQELGITVGISANNNFVISKKDAERLLNMLGGAGEPVKGTMLRVIK